MFSHLFFNWLSPLIGLGNQKVLEQDDLWTLLEQDTCDHTIEVFHQIHSKNGSLLFSMFRFVSPLCMYQWTCAIFSSLLSFAGPYFLYNIVQLLASSEEKTMALWYLVGLFISTCAKAIIDGQVVFFHVDVLYWPKGWYPSSFCACFLVI